MAWRTLLRGAMSLARPRPSARVVGLIGVPGCARINLTWLLLLRSASVR